MLQGAQAFDSDLDGWNVSRVETMLDMFMVRPRVQGSRGWGGDGDMEVVERVEGFEEGSREAAGLGGEGRWVLLVFGATTR